jgi:hypothetical protein
LWLELLAQEEVLCPRSCTVCKIVVTIHITLSGSWLHHWAGKCCKQIS